MTLKSYAKIMLMAVLSLVGEMVLRADVFTSSYTTVEYKAPKQITDMIIGPGVAVHPTGWKLTDTLNSQIGLYSNLTAQALSTFTNGIILSTGNIGYGNSVTNFSSSEELPGEVAHPFSPGEPRITDPDLDNLFGGKFYDPAGFVLYIQPKNKTINIPFIMASEEFYFDSVNTNEYASEDYMDGFDRFAFFFHEVPLDENGNVADDKLPMTHNIALLPDGGDVNIETVNPCTNIEYFCSNVGEIDEEGNFYLPSGDISLPMEFNGAITGLVAVAEHLDTNKVYKLKIVIGDASGNTVNSVLFLRARGITSGADLKIDVSGPTSMAEPGEVTFTDTVSNIGPAPADGVVVTNYLPIGATYVSCVPSATSFVTNSFGVTNGLVWTIGDRFQHGSNAVMKVTCNLPDAGWYTNIATVATSTGDYNPDNDRDQAIVKVGALPELEIAAVHLKKAFGEVITLADLGFVASVDGTNGTPATVTGIDVTFTNAQGQVANPAPTNALAAVGTYGIYLANVRGDNLDMFGSRITYVPGTLEITNANLKIKGATVKKCYGEPYTFTGKEFEPVTGLPEGVSVTSVVVTARNPAGTNVTDAVGEYPFDIKDAKGPGISNYTITYDPGLLIVTQRCVTVTANGTNMVYGTAAPATDDLTWLPPVGLAEGDFVGAVDLVYTNEYDTLSTLPVGTYEGMISTNGNDAVVLSNATEDVTANYRITFMPGALDVRAADLKVTAESITRCYSGATNRIETLVIKDKVSEADVTPVAVSNSADGVTWYLKDDFPLYVDVTNAAPVWIAVVADNYKPFVSSAPLATVTITQKVVTVTLNDQTNAYKSAVGAWTVKGVEGLIPGHGALTGVPGAIVGTPPTQVEGSPHTVTVGAGTLSAGPNYKVVIKDPTLTITPLQIRPLPPEASTDPRIWAPDVVKVYDGKGTNVVAAAYDVDDPVTFSYSTNGTTWVAWDALQFTKVTYDAEGNVTSNKVHYKVNEDSCHNYIPTNWVAWVTITQQCVTVTANSTNMVYGTTPHPTPTWRDEGLLEGDRSYVSLGYTNEVWDVGTYPGAITTNAAIVISNATGDVTANYLISFEPGDLEVTPLRAAVTVTNVMTCYDAEPHTIGYSSIPADATFHFATNNGTAWVWMDAAPQFTDVCTDVPVLVWADKLPAYTASPTNTAYVTITQKVVTVSLNNQTNAYKSAAGAWTVKGVEGLIPGHGALTGVPGAIVGPVPTQVEGSPHTVTVGAGTLSAGPNYKVVVKDPALTITPLQIRPLPPEASTEPRIWAPDVVKAYDGKGTNVVAAAYDVDDPVTFSYSTNGTTWVAWDALQFTKVTYDAEGNVTSNKVHYKVNEDSCHNYIPTNWVAWVTITPRVGSADLRTSASAKLNWNTGLLDLALTVRNEGDAAVDPGSDYWVELAPGPAADGVAKTSYINSPTGTLPDGADYIDLSAAVRAALKATGNRDEVFDPGEAVTLTDVSVYHWKRWSPEKFIDMEQFFQAGLLGERTQPRGRDVVMALAPLDATAPLRLGPASGVDAPAETSLANVYDGVLYDGDALAGTIHVQVAKVNRKTGLSNLTATLVPVGGQKVTVSGSFDPNAASFVATAKDGRTLELFVGKDGLGGSFDGFEVDGARNRYSSKDAEDKAVVAAADALIGSYSLANPCENGWEAYVVKIAKKGKVTIAGTLVDGSTVSASAQMIIGATGCCVPVIVSRKSVSRTFCIWFGENGIGIDGLDDAVIEHVGNLAAVGSLTFDVEKLLSLLENETVTVLSDYLPNGAEVLPNGKKWVVMPDAAGKALKTGSIVWDGKNGVVKTEKSKIDGYNVSGLKFTYTATTGVFKGSFKVFEIVKGGLKAVTANVTGVVVDGVGYGTVRVDKSGTVAAVIE